MRPVNTCARADGATSTTAQNIKAAHLRHVRCEFVIWFGLRTAQRKRNTVNSDNGQVSRGRDTV